MEPRSWIFLRGLTRGRGHWGDFVDVYQKSFPQDFVELLDLPGNGERNKDASPTLIRDYVDDMRTRSQALAEGRQVHILALSLGGMIAMDWAHRYPDEVKSLQLICTSSGEISKPWERFQPEVLPKVVSLAGANNNPEKFEKEVLKLISNNHERQEQLLSELVAHTRDYPVSVTNFFRQIWSASQFVAPQSPRVPTQIFGSWGDHLVSPKCSVALAKRWGLEPRMHPWSGHDIPIDDPQWLIQYMRDI